MIFVGLISVVVVFCFVLFCIVCLFVFKTNKV